MNTRRVLLPVICALGVVGGVWGVVLAADDCGEPVAAPKFQVGDKWVWRDEKGVEFTQEVIGFEGDLAKISWANPRSEPDKSGIIFIDRDGVLRKVLRQSGEEVTTKGAGMRLTSQIGEKITDYPLHVGKKWGYTSVLRRSSTGEMTHYDYRHEVQKCEKVSSAAGAFMALKIEVSETNTRTQSSGKWYVWYAPAAKGTVKTEFVPSRYFASALDNQLIKLELK